MKTNLIIILFLISGFSAAQVLISDNPQDVDGVHTDALLELRSISHDKGMLFPRVSLTGLNLPAPLSSHVKGMIVYNINISGSGPNQIPKGLYYNDGSSWNKIGTENPTIGDIKFSSETDDHEGWYLLDGRLASSLPSVSATNAISIGLVSLPDARDKFIKAGTGESMGATGGSTQISINQSNLPNVTFTGITNTTGSHSHTFLDRARGAVISGEQSGVSVFDDARPVTRTTSVTGDHTHTFTVDTGGSSQPIVFVPPYLAVNAFVYLGQ